MRKACYRYVTYAIATYIAELRSAGILPAVYVPMRLRRRDGGATTAMPFRDWSLAEESVFACEPCTVCKFKRITFARRFESHSCGRSRGRLSPQVRVAIAFEAITA